jgi:hypothetical protein
VCLSPVSGEAARPQPALVPDSSRAGSGQSNAIQPATVPGSAMASNLMDEPSPMDGPSPMGVPAEMSGSSPTTGPGQKVHPVLLAAYRRAAGSHRRRPPLRIDLSNSAQP